MSRIGLFDRHLQMIGKSLDFRAQRNNLLSGNIVNIEILGYKARDLVFEEALGQAMKAHEPGPLQVSDPRHLDGRPPTSLALAKPSEIQTSNPVGNVDGNSVDLEREMAKLAENQLAYQALTQMMTFKLSQLRAAIREGE
jgi:flagellar basal-body rod protein FlgB